VVYALTRITMENQIRLYHDATALLLEKDLGELKRFDEALSKRYEAGYARGWTEAKAKYCVTYYCSVCGGMIELDSDNEKAAVKGYMKENGWGHSKCVKRHG